MAFTEKFRLACFKLFCQDVPIQEIARQKKVSRVSLWKWVEKYSWMEERAKIRRKAREKVYGDLTKIKVDQYNLIQDIINRYQEQLSEGSVDIKTSDVVKLFEHQLMIAGEATKLPPVTFRFEFEGQKIKKKKGN